MTRQLVKFSIRTAPLAAALFFLALSPSSIFAQSQPSAAPLCARASGNLLPPAFRMLRAPPLIPIPSSTP